MKKVYLFLFFVCAAFLSNAQTTYTFTCPTTTTTWTVPAGVTSITFDVRGGSGGENDGFTTYDRGGYGARVQGTLTVVPGQVLNIYVGGAGASDLYLGGGGLGGFNGGGNGTYYYDGLFYYGAGGGGGASDIRIGGIAMANRVVVAGGGGGAGENGFVANTDRGGDGGGTTGEDGQGYYTIENGYGGTPTSGGAGGVDVV